MVFGNGESFCNCRQTSKWSCIKVASNAEFSTFSPCKIFIPWAIANIPQSIKFFCCWNGRIRNSRTDPWYFAMRDILLMTFLGYFPSVTKESQILICPNCHWNARIQCLYETFNTWINVSYMGLNYSGERVVSSKPLLRSKCSTIIFWQKIIVSSFNSH